MKLEYSKNRARRPRLLEKKADRKTAQKETSLLLEISQTPFAGKGKPERLLGNLSGTGRGAST